MRSEVALEPTPLTYHAAVRRLQGEFAWNPWFRDTYWPENEPRIRLVAQIALHHAAARGPVLDLGCANGYLAYLFRLMGFPVTAADAYDDEKRSRLFEQAGIRYEDTNLNEIECLKRFSPGSFEVVLLGEVFEHILNWPFGLLQAIRRVLRPGGLLVLTTPNPSTLANAVRLLRDKYVLWGTDEFLREPKITGERVIQRGDIHYREYPAWILRDAVAQAGFSVAGVRYVRAGTAPTHSLAKRFAKRLLLAVGIANLRLFSPGYVVWAMASRSLGHTPPRARGSAR